MKNLEQPLNSQERYLYGINLRLEILIEMFSSFLQTYAESNKIATTENIVQDEIPGQMSFDEVDYSKLTKSQIIEILEERNIDFNSRMTKADLLELLK